MPAIPASSEAYQTLARSVLKNNLKVRPGDRVIVEGWTHTLPASVAFAREVRRMKAQPLLTYEDETAYWDSVDRKEDKVLGTPAAHEFAALGKTNVYIHMWGPGDRIRLGNLPDARQEKLFGFNTDWYKTARKAKLRGARLEIGRPYPSLAKVYEADEATWRSQLMAATMVPPARLKAAGVPIERALRKGRQLRIHDDQGTDLTLGLAHYAPRANYGEITPEALKSPFGMLLNLPAGAIRVALDEKVAEGTIRANRSSYYETGKTTGGVFQFRDGRLTEATFATGGDLFDRGYADGGKGRDLPGFLSIGLNPELHNTPQVEDLEAGAVLVSLGGNAQLGGKTKGPFFGFVVNAGAKVEVDGRPVPLPG
ncbi:MAG TPA: aminopeptidase [Thermoplasmata archaeon]|nr:aminopeptidase [Thermoplasmata archaeon]